MSAVRRTITPAVLGLLSATAMTSPYAAQLPAKAPPPPPRTVYLAGIADLEHLRETNFYHYLRAKKILAAANEICRPKPEQTYFARFNGADPQCGAMWMTSLPPKKELTFHLDGVYYVALVTVTAYVGKAIPVHDPQR